MYRTFGRQEINQIFVPETATPVTIIKCVQTKRNIKISTSCKIVCIISNLLI